jgi:Fe-S cluster assembly protein SufD
MKIHWQDLDNQLATLDLSVYPEWFKSWREGALKDFNQHGLPHAKLDWWRQTPLKKIFSDQEASSSNLSHEQDINLPFDAYIIHVHGNQISWDFECPGLSIMPLLEAVARFPKKVKQALGKSYAHRDGLAALNSLLFQRGLYIHLEADHHLDKTLCIYHHSSSEQISFSRHLIIADDNTSLRLLEVFADRKDVSHFVHHVSELSLAKDVSLHHLLVQNCPNTLRFCAEVAAKQDSASQLNSFVMQKGGDISSCDFWIDLAEEHATVNISGLFLPKAQQFHQQRLQINHLVPHCYSTQNVRGILDDKAQGVFMGQVLVAHGAQKTHAHQTNKNLVLSKQAQVLTSPQLQIFADDVVCSHGATVGQLDEDALFYLQSRGFSAEEAKQTLVKAFVWAQFDVIADPQLRQWCMDQLYT